MNEWKPTEKQIQALERREFEILYGGARGGGKTVAGMAFLLYNVDNPLFRGLVIRRNSEDLKDWIDRARQMYLPLGAEVKGNPPQIYFPSGAIIRTGHLKDDAAYTKYQGHEYQCMVIEELTQISNEDNYEKLIQSCRSTNDINPQVFCTTNPNPGEPGHKWVMNRWQLDNPNTYGQVLKDEQGNTRVFISAKLTDNPHLMEKDPSYIKRLESIQDDDLRKAWLEGVWQDAEVKGAYYGAHMRKAKEEGRVSAVPYDDALLVNTAWDIGVGDYTAIVFFQVYGKEVRVIDYYFNVNEGIPHYVEVLRMKGYQYGEHIAPHDINVKEWGNSKTRLETARDLGIDFHRLKREAIEERIHAARSIFPFCYFDKDKAKELINTLESYRKVWNEQMQVFMSKPAKDKHTHGADAFGYMAQGMHLIATSSGDFDDSPRYGVDIEKYTDYWS